MGFKLIWDFCFNPLRNLICNRILKKSVKKFITCYKFFLFNWKLYFHNKFWKYFLFKVAHFPAYFTFIISNHHAINHYQALTSSDWRNYFNAHWATLNATIHLGTCVLIRHSVYDIIHHPLNKCTPCYKASW